MKAVLAPITAEDLPAVSTFLHEQLNPRVRALEWSQALRVPWDVPQPNHGFFLTAGDRVVGAYLAYYSEREVGGERLRICNLGAWCVLDSHRHQGLRLLTTLLKQPGYEFTDFSPSGNVVALNRKLKFTDLDTTTSLVPAMALPGRGVRVSSRPDVLDSVLQGAERDLYADHRAAAAARHVVLSTGSEHCYVVARKDTRKGVRAFATVLYASHPELLRRYAPRLASHLLRQHGAAATLVEHRVAGGAPAGSHRLTRSRPKMLRSEALEPARVDYLYSELTCLEW
ncbi:hypothetical protein [Nocardioides sp.]|uniref:hypothetical protein n=1 Tax=Nocardioides sp. TaxID=35761 RepID=UPI00198BDBFB|nr:hypothetical protein [Nocardioides sp.]MBC7278349.1 hypothetical protein [Nocardioides sp.]